MEKHLTRRGFLAATGGLAAGMLTGCSSLDNTKETNNLSTNASRKRVLRFAHFTDIHIRQDMNAPEGLTRALHHAQSLTDPPQLIVTGGDLINSGSIKPLQKTTDEWELAKKVFKNECSLPVKHCLGNHDTCVWPKDDPRSNNENSFWTKERPIHELNLPGRYYRFDQSGWRFILLDSTNKYPDKDVYFAHLDDGQFEWLDHQLQTTPSTLPVVIVSHIPILSGAVFELAKLNGTNLWVEDCEMHVDNKKIRNLFSQHPNVKLCLSGHLHLYDRLDYDGVSYVCDGAVCGSWWSGNFHRTDEGYGIIDLYSDGSIQNQYVSYSWQPAST